MSLVWIHFKKAFLFQSHAVSLCVIGFEYFCFHSHYKQHFQIYPPGKASSKISVSAGLKRSVDINLVCLNFTPASSHLSAHIILILIIHYTWMYATIWTKRSVATFHYFISELGTTEEKLWKMFFVFVYTMNSMGSVFFGPHWLSLYG